MDSTVSAALDQEGIVESDVAVVGGSPAVGGGERHSV
jgi:azurin